ncbi:MAG: phage tail tape measure protein [Bacteroidetes bacterium]|nr:phage tail tape measure protein [Bacteroidota bacterium]
MADQKIQVEVSGDSSGLLGALSKGLEGLKGFAEGVKGQMEKAAEGSGKFQGSIGQLEGKVKSLREELVKLKQAEMTGGPDGALSAQIKSTSIALSNAQRDLQLFKTHSTAAAEEGNKLKAAIDGISSVSPGAGSALSGFAGGPVAMVTAGILAAVGAAIVLSAKLVEITAHTAEQADEAGKASQKIGMSTHAFTQLSYAAKLADVDAAGLEKGLGKLAQNMQTTLWTPTSNAARSFDQLGISIADAKGELLPVEDVLDQVAEKFHDMQDGPVKTAAAMNIFGKAGKDLIPLLNQGKTAIAAMKLEADQLGVTFTEQDAKAAEEFNDNSKRLDFALQGVKNTIGKDLLPVLVEFAENAIEFAKDVLPSIITGVHFVTTAFYAFQEVADTVFDTIITDAKNAWAAISGLAVASAQAQSGNLIAAKNTMSSTFDEIQKNTQEHNEFLAIDAQYTAEKIAAVWTKTPDEPDHRKPGSQGEDGGKGDAAPNAPMYALWTKTEQETMDKLAAIRAKGFDELRKLTEVYNQGEAASRVQQIGFQEKAAEEALKRGDISNAEYIRRMQAFEDEKYQIQLKALQDEAAVDGLDAIKKQEIWNKIELLAQAHQNTMRVIGEHTVQQTAQNTKTLDTVVKTLQTGFGSAFANILTRAQTFSQAMGNFFRSMATTVLNALGQMIARTLIYKAVTIAANNGIISSENAKRVATLLGVQADTAATAATSAKASASSAAVGPNVANAASQTFETHSGIPIVGAIIAAALVLLMLSTMAKAKGRAVGGLVGEKGPELTMLGEKGLEVVAPEHDFKDWAKGLVGMGANLGANLTYQRAQVEALNRTAASYANAPLRQGGDSGGGGQTVINNHYEVHGHILDTSNRGREQLGRLFISAGQRAQAQYSVTIQPGKAPGTF